MKKRIDTKRLRFQRETIRLLKQPELGRAAGGMTTAPSCGGGCDTVDCGPPTTAPTCGCPATWFSCEPSCTTTMGTCPAA